MPADLGLRAARSTSGYNIPGFQLEAPPIRFVLFDRKQRRTRILIARCWASGAGNSLLDANVDSEARSALQARIRATRPANTATRPNPLLMRRSHGVHPLPE